MYLDPILIGRFVNDCASNGITHLFFLHHALTYVKICHSYRAAVRCCNNNLWHDIYRQYTPHNVVVAVPWSVAIVSHLKISANIHTAFCAFRTSSILIWHPGENSKYHKNVCVHRMITFGLLFLVVCIIFWVPQLKRYHAFNIVNMRDLLKIKW